MPNDGVARSPALPCWHAEALAGKNQNVAMADPDLEDVLG